MPAALEKPAASQINVRISAPLKEAGDAMLLKAGLSPTQAVRALWNLAAENADSPDVVARALFPDVAKAQMDGADAERRRRAKLIKDAPHIVERAFEHLGASSSFGVDSLSDDDLKEAAYAERFGESMGWM